MRWSHAGCDHRLFKSFLNLFLISIQASKLIITSDVAQLQRFQPDGQKAGIGVAGRKICVSQCR